MFAQSFNNITASTGSKYSVKAFLCTFRFVKGIFKTSIDDSLQDIWTKYEFVCYFFVYIYPLRIFDTLFHTAHRASFRVFFLSFRQCREDIQLNACLNAFTDTHCHCHCNWYNRREGKRFYKIQTKNIYFIFAWFSFTQCIYWGINPVFLLLLMIFYNSFHLLLIFVMYNK